VPGCRSLPSNNTFWPRLGLFWTSQPRDRASQRLRSRPTQRKVERTQWRATRTRLLGHSLAQIGRRLCPQTTVRPGCLSLQSLAQPKGGRPQHTSRTRTDSIQNGTERPPRVSLDCIDLGAFGYFHTLSVTCSARIRRTALHFDTCDDADTRPSLATAHCGQQRRGQRRSYLRKVADSISPITLPVGNTLARWQVTTRRATRSGFVSPFQTVGPTLVGMLSGTKAKPTQIKASEAQEQKM